MVISSVVEHDISSKRDSKCKLISANVLFWPQKVDFDKKTNEAELSLAKKSLIHETTVTIWPIRLS